MAQVKWTIQSKNDLKNIFDFIALSSIFYARKTLMVLRSSSTILKKYPHIGKEVPEYENDNIREIIEGNYRICYFISDENMIYILGVIHSARDIKQIELKIPE